MRCFKNIAKLIRVKRVSHECGYSQSELSHLLGYKNGQFISNVERALCNIPLKMLFRVAEVLDIPSDELKNAILLDHDNTLNNYLLCYNKSQEIPQRPVVSQSIEKPQEIPQPEELNTLYPDYKKVA
jgi:transcriptional regulator with XRE-family HTH domain